MIYNRDQRLIIRDYFEPIENGLMPSFMKGAESIERTAKIEEHPFFQLATKSREALILWTAQEAVVTNPFSQILCRVISNIKNVHIRSLLLPVLQGEHSKLREGIAEKSHPWLIWRLCKSLGISYDDVKPTKAVIDFIGVLESAADQPMRALGILGIGNELMLLSEYKAIEVCFDAMFPGADYKGFLHANIDEDEGHTKLIAKAALALTAFGFSDEEFLSGAKEGVAARLTYYDSLLKESL